MVKLVDVIISIILGIILNYFITSEIISYLFHGLDSIYNIVVVIAIIIQVLFIFIVIQLMRSTQKCCQHHTYQNGPKRKIIQKSDYLFQFSILILLSIIKNKNTVLLYYIPVC